MNLYERQLLPPTFKPPIPTPKPAPPPPMPKIYDQKKLKDAVFNLVKQNIEQFKRTEFNKVISLGNLDIYKNALKNVKEIVVDPNLKNVQGLYDPNTKIITVKINPMSIKYTDNQGDVFATTLWHELSHVIEDIHGDYGLISTLKGADYAERNAEFMQYVVPALKILAKMESKQGNLTSEEATKYWDMFIKSMAEAYEIPKYYKPDPKVLKDWFGFDLNINAIKDNYSKGKFSKQFSGITAKKESSPWVGEWVITGGGILTFTEANGKIEGNSGYRKLHGIVNGNKLTGTWDEVYINSIKQSGTFEFTLSEDRKKITGRWFYNGKDTGPWEAYKRG